MNGWNSTVTQHNARSAGESPALSSRASNWFERTEPWCAVGMMLVLLLLTSTNVSSAASKDRADDLFAARLKKLRRSEVGSTAQRDQLVSQYRAFVGEYATHPRVAEAMLDVVPLLRMENPELSIFAKDAESVEWLRKAAATAAPGSKVWYEAQFWLASEPHHSTVAGSRRILQRITEEAKGDSLTLARVEDILITLAMQEGDLDKAEHHCRRLLKWADDPSRVPTDPEQRRELNGLIMGAGLGLVNRFLIAPWPREKRAERIRSLMSANPGVQPLQREGYDVLSQLATAKYDDEHVMTVPPAKSPTVPPAKERENAVPATSDSPKSGAVDRPSRWWLAFAGGGLVVLGGVFAWLRARARRAVR